MNPLDARARSASIAINDSLAAATPPAPFATVVRRAMIVKAMNVAAVGVGLFLFISVGAAFRTPQPEVPVADTATSTTTTTTTTEAPPLTTTLAPETVDSSIVALPPTTTSSTTTTTTTSTTEAPPTTTTTTTTKAPPTTTTTTTTKPPDTTPPIIEIKFPENRKRFEKPRVTFRGVTEPGAKITSGTFVGEVDREGQWRLQLLLREGRNRVVVTATDAAGNIARDAVVVFYVPPDLAPFTAHAQFGSCAEDPPYDVYYGTGHPGTGVAVLSKYGTGTTKIGDSGEWELKVFFPEAPKGEAFVVRVQDEFGRFKTFEFTSHPGDGK